MKVNTQSGERCNTAGMTGKTRFILSGPRPATAYLVRPGFRSGRERLNRGNHARSNLQDAGIENASARC